MSEPTDLELMMLLDGELDAERRAEVEAFLAEAGDDEGGAARGKVAGMRAVSSVVGALSWPTARTSRSVDVVDGVMAAIESEVEVATTKPVEPKRVETASPPKSAQRPGAVSARPANDNSRAIFGFAIAAAAAAAALFFWGKSGDDSKVGSGDVVAVTTPSADRPETTPPDEPAAPLGDLAPEIAKTDPAEEPRYGVEVATVDFGARSGAIYYVPAAEIDDAASKAAVTTVVWLNDD